MSDLTNVVMPWPHNVGVPPDGDPKVFIIPGWLFPVVGIPGGQHFNFREETQRGLITGIQSLWIDNDTDGRIIVEIANASKQRIIGKARTQGWYPIMMTDENGLFVYSSAVVADPTAVRIGVANVNVMFGPYGI
jgi:hypothetical protein